MLEVLVNGCNGKMGQVVCDLVEKDEELLLKCGFDKENTGEFAFPVYTNINEITEKPDVIIDFSIPIATFNILEYAKENKVPVVIATTGFTEEQENLIKEYSFEDKIEIENMMNEKEIEKDKFAKYILEMLQTMIDDIIKKINEEKAQ